MHFHVVTIFPEILKPFLEEGVLGRAVNLKDKIQIDFYNPRDYTNDKHKKVDDRPFGGGPGMVIKAEPVLKAVEDAEKKIKEDQNTKKIILSPRGNLFDNKKAATLADEYDDVIIISGRYEGIDERVKEVLDAEEVSVGDFVLSGGELAAGIIIDAVSRQVQGVLGNKNSLEEAREHAGKTYTRPEDFEWKGKKYKVPEVLLSGHHKKIEDWRKKI